MDRVSEIIRLEGQADMDKEARSILRWQAARLVWEEHEAGKSFATLSKEIVEAGGRGSLGHLSRMERCWRVMVVEPGIVFSDLADLPLFSSVYNSPDIKEGAPDRERRAPRKRKVSRDRDDGGDRERDEDFSGHGLVNQAYRSISILTNNPAFLPMLTEGDWATIRALWPLLEKITASYVPMSEP